MSGAVKAAAVALDAALVPEGATFDALADAVAAVGSPCLDRLFAAHAAARFGLVSAVCDACASLDAVPAPAVADSPVHKALAASHAADARRLRRAASTLNAAIPAHGVLFDRVMRVPGKAPVRVQLRWPGVLVVRDPLSEEIILESFAADMYQEAPEEARFVVSKAKGRALKSCTFQPPQGARLRATVDAAAVVRVYAISDGALLAESEPGRPTVLRNGFQSLIFADLEPRNGLSPTAGAAVE